MPWTNFGKSKLLGPCGGVPTTFPVNWHIGITSTDPGPTGIFTGEFAIGVNGYTRVSVANDIAQWDGPGVGGANNGIELLNQNNIVWPDSLGAWGSAVYVFGSDAASAGNVWWYYPVPGGAIAIDRAGVVVAIEFGTLKLRLEDTTT